jgi:hypothetical protein
MQPYPYEHVCVGCGPGHVLCCVRYAGLGLIFKQHLCTKKDRILNVFKFVIINLYSSLNYYFIKSWTTLQLFFSYFSSPDKGHTQPIPQPMQKILYFEITTAIKDRPKIFQIVTLMLFAFSLTVIFIGSLTRLSSNNADYQVSKQPGRNHFVRLLQTPSQPVVNLQK